MPGYDAKKNNVTTKRASERAGNRGGGFCYQDLGRRVDTPPKDTAVRMREIIPEPAESKPIATGF